MKRVLKLVLNKKIYLVILVLLSTFLFACTGPSIETFYIKRLKELNLYVYEEYTFEEEYYSSNPSIFKIEDNIGTALNEGDVTVYKDSVNSPIFIVHIKNDAKYISAEFDNILKVGDSVDINVVVSPLSVSQEVEYEISDENIIKVEDGKLYGLSLGYADLTITSKVNKNVKTKLAVIVQNEDEINYDDEIEFEIDEENNHNIDPSKIETEINALIKTTYDAFVGICQYTNAELTDFGGGVLYKRNAISKDDVMIEDFDLSKSFDDIKGFEYYVITTRNFASVATRLSIYLGEDYDTYDATLVEFDPKVDLALLKFTCPYYLPLVKFGDSDNIRQGEFVISINNSNGKDYFKTVTYGIISHTKRYVAVDTDEDQTSDWDSEFIQHDASINSDSAKKVVYTSGDIYNYINGGALINLKGELIGLDSMKITAVDSTINNMSLSIPTNLIEDIVSILITGNKPQRPLLGVTILDITSYYKNKDYYNQAYGYLNIPDGLEYGFYISDITEGGVAYQASARVGDILLKFNGIETRYSYMLRAELGKFIIGSGDTASLVVLRNGEEVTLTVTF